MVKPPRTWLITDTHINHELMYRVGRPPGYIELLINNCQKVIRDIDRVIHLGDVILRDYMTLPSYLNRIPGRKILVRGNHDSKTNTWYENNGFILVVDQLVLGNVIYSHKPLKNFPDGVIYNVHGHWHDNDHREDESVSFYDRRRHIKLAIEDTNYTPITVSDILYKGKLLASAKDDNKDNLGKFKT